MAQMEILPASEAGVCAASEAGADVQQQSALQIRFFPVPDLQRMPPGCSTACSGRALQMARSLEALQVEVAPAPKLNTGAPGLPCSI